MGSNNPESNLFIGLTLAVLLVLALALAIAVVQKPDSGSADTDMDSYSGNTIFLSDPALAGMQAPANSLIAVTVNKYTPQADDIGTSENWDLGTFRPAKADGVKWFWIGDVADNNYKKPGPERVSIIVNASDPYALAKPLNWTQAWSIQGGKYRHELAIWVPVAPEGYVALGCVATNSFAKPNGDAFDSFRCVNLSYCVKGSLDDCLWNDFYSGATEDGAIWHIVPVDEDEGVDAWTYYASGLSGHVKPNVDVWCLNNTYLVG
jgi:hypothetical protein